MAPAAEGLGDMAAEGAAGHTTVCGHDEPDTARCQPALSGRAASWMQISGSPPRTKAITPQKLAFDTASGATYVANMDDNTGSVLGP